MGVPFISHKEGVMPVYWMNDNQPLRFTERFDLSFPPRNRRAFDRHFWRKATDAIELLIAALFIATVVYLATHPVVP